MTNAGWLDRHGRLLLRAGAAIFLGALLVGLVVQRFTLPRLGLAAHMLGVMQGTFLMVLGLAWGRLRLARVGSRIGSSLAVYGCVAAWSANLLGATWGAGGSMVPIAAAGTTGAPFQERLIAVLLVSAALSLISAVAVVLWGLRGPDT